MEEIKFILKKIDNEELEEFLKIAPKGNIENTIKFPSHMLVDINFIKAIEKSPDFYRKMVSKA